MNSDTIVPDYIIYDEIKKRRQRDERPQLEIPQYKPYWPESELDSDDEEVPREDEETPERGEVVIPMW